MEALSPAGPHPYIFTHSVLPDPLFKFEMKAGSGPSSSPSDSEDDIDGCCVQAEVLTSDEELPAAEGGVA